MLKNRHLPLIRTIASVVALVMIFEVAGVPLAQAFEAKVFWQERQSHLQIPPVVPSANLTSLFQAKNYSARDFELPASIGQVTETWSPSNSTNLPRIIHIRDVHDQPQVQLNIAEILSRVFATSREDQLRVALEGAWTVLDFAPYNRTAYDEWREMTARAFLERNYITGAQYFALIHRPQQVALEGIEKREDYLNNLLAKERSEKSRERMVAALQFLKKRMDRVGRVLLPLSILEFERNRNKFASGLIEQGDYLAYLLGIAPQAKAWSHISNFLALQSLEKKIDQARIGAEREKLIRKIVEKGNKGTVDRLISISIAFKEGRLSDFGYQRELDQTARAQGLPISSGLQSLGQYLEKSQELSVEGLMDETENLEALAGNTLAAKVQRYADLRVFLAFSKALDKQEKLWSLELTPKTVSEVIKVGESLDWVEAERFLFNAERNLGLKPFPRVVEPDYRDALRYVKDFYSLALERDKNLVQGLIRNLKSDKDEKKTQNIVLIAGGFHTAGLTRLLRANGFPYLVIQPALNFKEGRPNKVKIEGRLPDPWQLLRGATHMAIPLKALSISGVDPTVAGSLAGVAKVASGQAALVDEGDLKISGSNSAVTVAVKKANDDNGAVGLLRSLGWFALSFAVGFTSTILTSLVVQLAPVVLAALPLEFFGRHWVVIAATVSASLVVSRIGHIYPANRVHPPFSPEELPIPPQNQNPLPEPDKASAAKGAAEETAEIDSAAAEIATDDTAAVPAEEVPVSETIVVSPPVVSEGLISREQTGTLSVIASDQRERSNLIKQGIASSLNDAPRNDIESWKKSQGIPNIDQIRFIMGRTGIKVAPSYMRSEKPNLKAQTLGLRLGFLAVMGVKGEDVNRVYASVRDGSQVNSPELKANGEGLKGSKVLAYAREKGLERVKGYAVDYWPLVAIIKGGLKDPKTRKKTFEALLWLERQQKDLKLRSREFWVLTESIFKERPALAIQYGRFKQRRVSQKKPRPAEVNQIEKVEVEVPGKADPLETQQIVPEETQTLPPPVEEAELGQGTPPELTAPPATETKTETLKPAEVVRPGRLLSWFSNSSVGRGVRKITVWLVLLAVSLPILGGFMVWRARSGKEIGGSAQAQVSSSSEEGGTRRIVHVVEQPQQDKKIATVLRSDVPSNTAGQATAPVLKKIGQGISESISGRVGNLRKGMADTATSIREIIEQSLPVILARLKAIGETVSRSQGPTPDKAPQVQAQDIAEAQRHAIAKRNLVIAKRMAAPSIIGWFRHDKEDLGVTISAPLGMREASRRHLIDKKFRLPDESGKLVEPDSFEMRLRSQPAFLDYAAKHGTFWLDNLNGESGPWAARTLMLRLEEEGVVFDHEAVVSRGTGFKPDWSSLTKPGPQNFRFRVLDRDNDYEIVQQFVDEEAFEKWAKSQEEEVRADSAGVPFDKEHGFVHPLTEDGRLVLVPVALAVTLDPDSGVITGYLGIPKYDPKEVIQPVNVWVLQLETSHVYPYLPPAVKKLVKYSTREPMNDWTEFLSRVYFRINLQREENLTEVAGNNRIIVQQNGLIYAYLPYLDSKARSPEDMRLVDPSKEKDGLGDRVILAIDQVPYPSIFANDPEPDWSSIPVSDPELWELYFNTKDGYRTVIDPLQEAIYAHGSTIRDARTGVENLRQAGADVRTARAQQIATDRSARFKLGDEKNKVAILGENVELNRHNGTNVGRPQAQISDQWATLNPERGMVFTSDIPALGDETPFVGRPALARLELPFSGLIKWDDPGLKQIERKIAEAQDPVLRAQLEDQYVVFGWLITLEAYEVYRLGQLEGKINREPGKGAVEFGIHQTEIQEIDQNIEILRKARGNAGVIGRPQVARAYAELAKLLGINVKDKEFVPYLGSDMEALEDLLIRYQRSKLGLPRIFNRLQEIIPQTVGDTKRSATDKENLLRLNLRLFLMGEIREFYTARYMRRVQAIHDFQARFSAENPNVVLDGLKQLHEKELHALMDDTLRKIRTAKMKFEPALEREVAALLKDPTKIPTAAEAKDLVERIIQAAAFDDTSKAEGQFSRLRGKISERLSQLAAQGGTPSAECEKALTLARQIEFAEKHGFASVVPRLPAFQLAIRQQQQYLNQLERAVAATNDSALKSQYLQHVKDQTGKSPLGFPFAIQRSLRFVEAKAGRNLGQVPNRASNRSASLIHRVQNRGGAWFRNPLYWRFAFGETPLVFLVAAGFVNLGLTWGLNPATAGLIWFLAPIIFRLGHYLGNPEGLYSPDVRTLTRAKWGISAVGFFFTFSGQSLFWGLIFVSAILALTLVHMQIQLTTTPNASLRRMPEEGIAREAASEADSVRRNANAPVTHRRNFLKLVGAAGVAGSLLAAVGIGTPQATAGEKAAAVGEKPALRDSAYVQAKANLDAHIDGMVARAMITPSGIREFTSPHEDDGFLVINPVKRDFTSVVLPNRQSVEKYFEEKYGGDLWKAMDETNNLYEARARMEWDGTVYMPRSGYHWFQMGKRYQYFILDLKNGEIIQRFFTAKEAADWVKKDLRQKDFSEEEVKNLTLYKRLSEFLFLAPFAEAVTLDARTGKLTGSQKVCPDHEKSKIRLSFKYPSSEEQYNRIKALPRKGADATAVEWEGRLYFFTLGWLDSVFTKEGGRYYYYGGPPPLGGSRDRVLGMRAFNSDRRPGDIVLASPLIDESLGDFLSPIVHSAKDILFTPQGFHRGSCNVQEVVHLRRFGDVVGPGRSYLRVETLGDADKVKQQLEEKFAHAPKDNPLYQSSLASAYVALRWLADLQQRLLNKLAALEKGNDAQEKNINKHLDLIQAAREQNWVKSPNGVPIFLVGKTGFELALNQYSQVVKDIRLMSQKKQQGKIAPEEEKKLAHLESVRNDLLTKLRFVNRKEMREYYRDSLPHLSKYEELMGPKPVGKLSAYLDSLEIKIKRLAARPDLDPARKAKIIADWKEQHMTAGHDLFWETERGSYSVNPGWEDTYRVYLEAKGAHGYKDEMDTLPKDEWITDRAHRAGQTEKAKTGGSWSQNLYYIAEKAHLETPKVFLGAMILVVFTGNPLFWFCAPVYYWVRHIFSGSTLFSDEVLSLTLAKALIAAFGYLGTQGGVPFPIVVLAVASWTAALTFIHREIQLSIVPKLLEERFKTAIGEGTEFDRQKVVNPVGLEPTRLTEAKEVAPVMAPADIPRSPKKLAVLTGFLKFWLGSKVNNDPVVHLIEVKSLVELKDIARSIELITTMRAGRGDDLTGTEYALAAPKELASQIPGWIENSALPSAVKKNLRVLELPEESEGMAISIVSQLSGRTVSATQIPDRTFNLLLSNELAAIVMASRPKNWEKKVLVNPLNWNGPDGEAALARALISFYFHEAEANGMLKILQDYGSLLNFRYDTFTLIAKMA